MQWTSQNKVAHALITNHLAIGISLGACSGDDIRIQSNPIATRQLSRDTSNHFQRNSQQPENSQ